MVLTAPPSLSNTSPATPAASRAWMGPSSPRCPCLRRNRLDPLSAPSTQGSSEATAPPAPPTSRPSTSAPPKRCTTAASASPTCPRTTRTRHWPRRCPPCTAPCWGTPSEDDLRISTPTPEQSALRCDLADGVLADLPALRRNQRPDGAVAAQLMESQSRLRRQGFKWSLKTVIGHFSVYSMLTEVTSTVDWRAAVKFWPLHAPVKTVNVDCYVSLLNEGCRFCDFPVKASGEKREFFLKSRSYGGVAVQLLFISPYLQLSPPQQLRRTFETVGSCDPSPFPADVQTKAATQETCFGTLMQKKR